MTATSDKPAGTEHILVPAPGYQIPELWREWLSASPDPLVAMLDGAVRERGPSPTAGSWRRTHARLEVRPAASGGLACTLVYQIGQGAGSLLYLVECRDSSPDARSPDAGAPDAGSHADLRLPWGSVRALPFWQDPGLPTLPRLLAANPTAEVLRYRPRHRATLRVKAGDLRFAKVFPDERGLRLYDEGLALWQAAASGGLTFSVPEPLRWDPDTRTLWMGPVAGEPLKHRLRGPGGADLAERMGRACGELTVSGPAPTQRFSGAEQMSRSGRCVMNLSILAPHLADEAEHLLDDLATIHAGLARRMLRPVHGAPRANQWLYDGDRLGLVDFDGYCLGDPELDAAAFVAEIECENPATTPHAMLSTAFLRGYAGQAGPLEPSLLNAYRAHQRLAKAEKNARKPVIDAAERAARHLAAASRMLVAGGLTTPA